MSTIDNLKNKVVVVTGAASGIGRSIAHLFSENKASLVIADKDEKRLQQVEEELHNYGTKVSSIVVDVSDLKQVEELSDFAIKEFGQVDILINNAGIALGGPSDVFPLEDFEKLVNVNFWSIVYGVQSFIPVFKKQGYGHIVNISSLAGLVGHIGIGAYSATKHAVVGYSEVLRAELRRYNIGVTVICPGIINTNIVQDAKITHVEKMKVDQSQLINFYKNWGWPPERVAKAVLKAVKKNKGVVPVGPEAWLCWYIKRFSQKLWELYMRLSVKVAY